MSFFQTLFGIKNKGLSKVEYWKKWEFFELLDDLHIALKACEQLTISQKTKENENFHDILADEIDNIEFGNKNDLNDIWILFSPGGQWVSIMKQSEKEVGERIFERADRWKKASS
jgi:hypothetical protein